MKLYYNPEYLRWKDEFQEAFDLYEGRHDVLTRTNYLWLHGVEDTTNKQPAGQQQAIALRAGRCQRTRYLNISEILVSIWTSLFFRDDPTIPQQIEELFGGSTDNIDGSGKSLFTLIKSDIFNNILLYGRAFILADAPQGSPTTKAEELAMGIYPRLRSLHPMAITDWDIETLEPGRLGQLNMLRHEYTHLQRRLSAQEKPVEIYKCDELTLNPSYIVRTYEQEAKQSRMVNQPLVPGQSNYTSDSSYEQAGDWINPVEIVTKLSKIPVAYYIERPWLREANQEILRHFNIRSNRDNILFQQGFDRVFTKGVDYGNPAAVQALTEYTTVGLPENGDAFKLDPVDLGAYERAEAEAFTNALKAGFNMLRTLPADSREGLSAQSLAAEKENLYTLVESTLDDVEDLVNESIRNAALFKGIEDFQEETELSRSGTEQTVEQFITLSQAFMDKLGKYPLAQKDLMLKAAQKLDLSDEALKEIKTLEVQVEQAMSAQDVVNNAMSGGMNGQTRPPNSK